MKGKKFKTIFCNLFAGPGAGKSTIMASVFTKLKWAGIDCEMVTEYAKDKVWEGSAHILKCQPYIFGKQLFRLYRMNGKVPVVITDSPILLSPIYDIDKSAAFLTYVVEQFRKFKNYNVFLERVKDYNPNGRMQTLKEAVEIDTEVLTLLRKTGTSFTAYKGTEKTACLIAKHFIKTLRG